MFRDIVYSMCCVVALLGEVVGIDEMEDNVRMPRIAYSQGECKSVSAYHAYISNPESGFKFFMPRSAAELEELYVMYNTGKINGAYGFTPSEILWHAVSENIKQEFLYRCMDEEENVIDEYVSWFEESIKLLDKFRDQLFLKPLYESPSLILVKGLQSFIGELESVKIKGSPFVRSSTHLLPTLSKIDEFFDKSSNFKRFNLLKWHKATFLTEEFIGSPACTAIYDELRRSFTEGFSPETF
jgi:hypothetical protein